MSNQKVTIPIPELRFKMDDGSQFPDWKIVSLKSIAKRQTAKNTDEKIVRVLTNSAVGGILDQKDYFKKDIAVKGNLQGYYIVDKNDYVYNPRISAVAPVGPISKNKIGKGVMSPLYTVFSFNNENSDFYEQYFKSSEWHGYLQTISNTGARHDRMSISANDFMEMPLPNPDRKEQQKIVYCLSSADKLFVAESQKLKVLKVYKKGLMQQLFPAVDETLPKLRFPEFQSEIEWSIVSLSNISDVKGGKRIPKGHSLTEENTGLPYIRVSDMYMGGVDINSVMFITKEVENSIKNYKISKNDLFITVAGTIGIVGEIPKELDNANLTENANKIIVKGVDKRYLLQYLCSDRLQNNIKSSVTNNAQSKLSLERIRSFDIPLPKSNEQKKIADFLSSLDKLITAQKDKVESLKAHKQGLIQKLFPRMSTEE